MHPIILIKGGVDMQIKKNEKILFSMGIVIFAIFCTGRVFKLLRTEQEL